MFGFGFSPMLKQPFSSIVPSTFPSGMVSSYSANGSFNDSTGSNHLTAYNGVLSNSTPKLGSGGFFYDGINDSTAIAVSPFTSQAFSYSFWAKPVALNVGIFTTQSSNDGYRIVIYPTGQLFFRRFYATGSFEDITTSVCITTGTYHHIVVTRDNTNGTKIYCNNSLVGSSSNLGVTYYNGGGFRMGADLVSGYINPYSGYIDAMQVFNKVLDTTEISSLYNSGIGREV